MKIHQTSMCAMEDIGGLSNHDTPKEAMFAFCKLRLKKGIEGSYRYRQGMVRPSGYEPIYSFFLFSAALYDGEEKNYGEEFAKFIRNHKLGSVKASPIKTNDANHPDHSNRIWVWTPNQDKLEKWYEREQALEYWRPPINTQFGPIYEYWRFPMNNQNKRYGDSW